MQRIVMFGLVLLVVVGAWLAPTTTEPASAQGGYYATVEAAAYKHGADPGYLWLVVGCETGGTYALNLWGPNGEYGPFQFMEGTFYNLASISGLGGSWQDPYSQAQVAAWAFANGYGDLWACP
jgi:hypothetical protein